MVLPERAATRVNRVVHSGVQDRDHRTLNHLDTR